MFLFKDDESYELKEICARLNGYREESCKKWIKSWRIPHSIINRKWCVLGKYLNQAIGNGPPIEEDEDDQPRFEK